VNKMILGRENNLTVFCWPNLKPPFLLFTRALQYYWPDTRIPFGG
jgi:hypothetical protein